MFKMVGFFFKAYEWFFLDIGHVMGVILLCEVTETSKRSRTESYHLMGCYAHYIKLCCTKLTDGNTVLTSVAE